MSYRNRWNRGSSARSPAGGMIFGIVIIAVGAIMLLDNMNIVRARDFWDYAPLLLVALGAVKILDAHGRPPGLIFGALMAVAGTVWFLENIDLFRFDTRLIWPVLIIAFGVASLARALDRSHAVSSSDGVPGAPSSEPVLNVWTVFGGSKRVIDSTDLRAGDLIAVFGGVDVDLRPANINGTAVIDATAVFGGIEIRVPLNWAVDVRGTGIFGGYEDKTIHPAPDAPVPAPKLVVTGIAVFGGVSISNA